MRTQARLRTAELQTDKFEQYREKMIKDHEQRLKLKDMEYQKQID